MACRCGGGAGRPIPFMSFVTRPRRRGRRVVKIWKGLALERPAHDPFESPDQVIIFRRNERERVACALRASRATDAMDVGVSSVRHVEVDDVRDALHVEAARRNVGGDHDAEMSALETAKRLLTLSLRAIAVQARDAMTRVRDLTRQLFGAMFGACEDQHRFGGSLFEQLQQQR